MWKIEAGGQRNGKEVRITIYGDEDLLAYEEDGKAKTLPEDLDKDRAIHSSYYPGPKDPLKFLHNLYWYFDNHDYVVETSGDTGEIPYLEDDDDIIY